MYICFVVALFVGVYCLCAPSLPLECEPYGCDDRIASYDQPVDKVYGNSVLKLNEMLSINGYHILIGVHSDNEVEVSARQEGKAGDLSLFGTPTHGLTVIPDNH